MTKALKLEWLKLRNYRAFWVIVAMYLMALMLIAFGGGFFLKWLKAEGADFEGLDPTILPIYDFPDIWQNLTYLASFLKVLIAFIVVISVTNDLTYNTLRQNVIDGISKREYLISKMMLIVALALVSTLFLVAFGMINGLMYSHVMDLKYIFDEWEFLAAYAFDIITYCAFAFLVALLVKKSGFVIVGLFLYTLMFEPIAAVILQNAPPFADTIWPEVVHYFPIKALNNLISVPFPKYMFREIETNIPIKAIVIAFGWLVIYLTVITRLLTKRDLK